MPLSSYKQGFRLMSFHISDPFDSYQPRTSQDVMQICCIHSHYFPHLWYSSQGHDECVEEAGILSANTCHTKFIKCINKNQGKGDGFSTKVRQIWVPIAIELECITCLQPLPLCLSVSIRCGRAHNEARHRDGHDVHLNVLGGGCISSRCPQTSWAVRCGHIRMNIMSNFIQICPSHIQEIAVEGYSW